MRTHVVEMLGGFHDVRRPFIFLYLHPALAEELPAGRKEKPRAGEMSSALLIQCGATSLIFEVIIYRGAALGRGPERKEP